MQFPDQHVEAIRPTVRVTDQVEACVFSDKVKEMGRVKVARGRIEITLDFLPGMTSHEATRDFLVDAIGLALKACFDARREAFEGP